MAKLTIDNNSTGNILRVFLQDSGSTTGAGKTGLTTSSAGLKISVIAERQALAQCKSYSTTTYIKGITTIGTFEQPTSDSECRFAEIGSSDFPGLYEIHLHDNLFAHSSGSPSVKSRHLIVCVQATGVAPVMLEIQQDQSDAMLKRSVANVETTAVEHTLCTLVLAALENSLSGTSLTIKRTDGTTTHVSKTVGTAAASSANVITSVS